MTSERAGLLGRGSASIHDRCKEALMGALRRTKLRWETNKSTHPHHLRPTFRSIST